MTKPSPWTSTYLTAMVNKPRWASPVTKAEMAAGDGARNIRFIQRHCRIDKDSVGGRAGDLIKLRDWQQLQLYRLFARREDGLRKHRVGLIGLPKKNGKSAKSSGIGLAEADQGPEGGEVYCCAGDREQARIVFGTAKAMVEMDPELSARVTPYKNELVWPETGTKFKVLSAESKLKEGVNPTLVIFDEVHVQPNDDLWDIMEQGFGSRLEPMMLGITTAGDPTDSLGNDSLCYRLYQHGCKVATGEIVDPSFFFAWWEPLLGHRADWRDPDVWAETNPGLGDIVSLEDFQAKVIRGPEAVVRTKRLNMWVPGKLAAVPSGKWEARTAELPVPVGETITFGVPDDDVVARWPASEGIGVPSDWLVDSVGFLDGSWDGDCTGLVCSTRDGFLFVIVHHEKDETDGPDWRVPVNSVKADIRTAFAAGMRGLLLDPFRWQQTAADLEDEGYPVVEWPTSHVKRIGPAWKDFYAAILDGELSHDGHPAMARHIGNVVLKIDASGARPVKTSKTSKRHIDLAICATGAYANRELEFTSGPKRARLWSAVS